MPRSLAARVLAQEHVIYPLALRLLCETIVGGTSRAQRTPDAATALLNPLPPRPGVP